MRDWDWIEWVCWGIVAALFALCICAAITDHRLENQKAYCSQKFEKTADYLACLKPVEDQLKQEADDAAVVASVAATSTVIMSN